MKALWVVNVPPARAGELMGATHGPFGGWLDGALTALRAVPELEVTVAFPHTSKSGLMGTADGVRFVAFPPVARGEADSAGVTGAAALMASESPDILHLHGTELTHALSFTLAARAASTPVVVSIQGLVSVCSLHMTAHLPAPVVYGLGSRPWRRSDQVAGMRRAFTDQGRLEEAVLQQVQHVIGRTTWDKACVLRVNPHLKYHHCDETLRPEFYETPEQTIERSAAGARPTLLMGQGHYPIKGLHLALEALAEIRRHVHDVRLWVTGHDPLAAPTAYARHLRRLVRELDLEQHLEITGPQDVRQMISRYRAADVVLCPSVVENSPNTVAEGMIMGRPVVAAHVGGVPDMVTHGQDGLTYQSDAPYMLAHWTRQLLEDPTWADELGEAARARALARHDPATNAARTLEIYHHVISERGTHS